MTANVELLPAALSSHADMGMKARVDSFDWATTPLGAREAWPQSLVTTVDVMLGSGYAMCLAWGAERTFLYNDAYASFLGERHPDALGRSMEQVWPDVWPDIEPLVARTYAGETMRFVDMPLIMTRNGYPEDTWWDFSYSPVHDKQKRVAGLLNVTNETTSRVLAERTRDQAISELRESQAFMASVLAASTDCIKVLELDGTLSFMSEGGMKVMEISDFNAVKGCPWPDFMKDGGIGLASKAIEAARQGRSSHFEAPVDTYIGTPKFWSVSVSPIMGEDGNVARILSVSRDHTELEAGREQQRLLNGELSHRLKNTLAMVQSIANQTLRDAETLEEASAAFSSRLASLGQATDVLTRSSWQEAELHAIMAGGLAVIETQQARISYEGPRIRLNPQATLALTLALHELATNAIKYGALSNDTGTVTIRWLVEQQNGEPRFSFLWQEQGGPPVSVPTRRGFGSRMIERSLRSYLRGTTELSYPETGVEFRINAPLNGAGEMVEA